MSYWKKREAIQLAKNIQSESEYTKIINGYYDYMLDQIQKEIDSFYTRYAKSESITMSEARKRVTELDIDAYSRKAERYVKDKTFSKEANEEMRLYNATMKINRLEMLKANIGLDLVDGFDELQKYFDTILTDRTLSEFERQAGILGKSVQNNSQLANAIVNASFKNATFSDRVWMHQGMLKAELSKLLQTGLIQGKNSKVLARELRKTFNVSKVNAERLMRTEMARVQTEAQKQSFERNGYEEYEFIAENDAKTCSVCSALDGEIFKVKDMMPGENAAPVHPNCRCSVAAHMDRDEFEKWLDGQRSSERGLTSGDYRIGSNSVDLNFIESERYKSKFKGLSESQTLNDAIYKNAVSLLKTFHDTDTEGTYIIDSVTGKTILNKTGKENAAEITLSHLDMSIIKNNKNPVIGVHNHPTNLYPTGSDFGASAYRKYEFGVIVAHDGSVYKYSTGDRVFNTALIDMRIDKYAKEPYNMDIGSASIKALNEIRKEYGITWHELE